jgi:hypothetical protein
MADGEFFDVEAQEIKLFGTPWHGPVQDGSLALPNEATMTYPQPSEQATRNAGDEEDCDYFDAALAGTNHLIAIPDLPAVTRTTEEAAADTAAGRQWKTQALLSGGRLQLYGHNLKGWIYIDPAGDRWLVTCPAFWPYPHLPANAKTTALNATVRLTRFGIIPIGGEQPAPEHYDYSVSLAAGWLTSPSDTVYIHPTIDALTRTGNKAAIGLHTGFSEVEGYLELTISGAGDDATVALSVLRTFAQCSSATVSGSSSDTGPGDRLAEVTESRTVSRLYALWYDDAGSVVEVRVDGTSDYSWTLVRDETWETTTSPPIIDYMVGAIETRESTSTAEMTVSVGGVAEFTFAGSAETSWVGTWSGGTPSTSPTLSAVWSGSASLGDDEFSDSGSDTTDDYADAVAEVFLAPLPPGAAGLPGPGGYQPRDPWNSTLAFWSGHGWTAPDVAVGVTFSYPGNRATVAHELFCHSRHCVGMLTRVSDGEGVVSGSGSSVRTPAGEAGDAIALSGPPSIFRRRDWEFTANHPNDSGLMYYGSYDWLTGAVALWQETPVNFV